MDRRGSNRLTWILILLATWGCGGGESESSPQPESLEAWFVRVQADTELPHGRVLTETVHQEGESVEFQTSDGTTLRQQYRPASDGGYERVGDPAVIDSSSGE